MLNLPFVLISLEFDAGSVLRQNSAQRFSTGYAIAGRGASGIIFLDGLRYLPQAAARIRDTEREVRRLPVCGSTSDCYGTTKGGQGRRARTSPGPEGIRGR